jgi:tRNA 2-thiouridine synthesizing protein E
MTTVTFKSKTYEVDSEGFLLDFNQWDKDYAEGVAPELHIEGGLRDDHWEIIAFMRKAYLETGRCPLVFQTCLVNRLSVEELDKLFPTGYLRGACKLAGITYGVCFAAYSVKSAPPDDVAAPSPDKVYSVNVNGFLVDPSDWDESFAIAKAYEMKMQDRLNENHWQILHYLRKQYEENGSVPTVFATCRAHRLSIEDLERLFPDGYHRGAVKLAGLR